jgi:hypothetical protein
MRMTSTGDESEAEPTDPDNGWGALSSAFDEQPPPAGRTRTGVIAGVVVGVLVLGAAAGVAGTAFVLRSDDTSASASGPASPSQPAVPGDRSATAEPTPTEKLIVTPIDPPTVYLGQPIGSLGERARNLSAAG